MASPFRTPGVVADLEGLSVLEKQLDKLKGLRVTLGYQGAKGATVYAEGKDPPNVATVALWQEFGTIDIPARGFLRATMVEQSRAISETFAVELKRVFDCDNPRDPVDALAAAGARIVKLIKRKIDTSRQWATPNAPSTVAKKGDDYPLHESDLMSESVTYAVRRGETVLREGP